MSTDEMGDHERIRRLENLAYELNKSINIYKNRVQLRTQISIDTQEENIKLRRALLEVAYYNDPEEKKIYARKVLAEFELSPEPR